MNRRAVIIIVLLAVATIGIVVYYARRGSPVPAGYNFEPREPAAELAPTAPGEAKPEPVDRVEPAAVAKSAEEQEAFVYDSNRLRNPMTPLLTRLERGGTVTEPARGALKVAPAHKLGAIIWSPSNPLAIIDGNVMGVGETLRDGSMVTEIGRNFVALKRDGKKFRLALE